MSTTDRAAVLCIIGTGPEKEALEALARGLGLGGRVRFTGRIDDPELVLYYQAANVSVVPSVALEGYGLVVLESLATGTPVVASALDGLRDSLAGLAPDLLVPPGNPKALAERLGAALSGEEPLPAEGECRQHAERNSWREVACRHVELYRRVVDAARQARGKTVVYRRLRVVIVGHTAQLSGGELAIRRAISSITADMHVILAEDGPLVPLLESAGASVEILPMSTRARNLRKDRVRPGRLPLSAGVASARYVFVLARRLRRIRPDIVHTNTLKAALYGGCAARLARIPCVWHIRDRIAPDYLPRTAVWLVRAAARIVPGAIIANSQVTLETLRVGRHGRAVMVNDSVTAVIPSPVAHPTSTSEEAADTARRPFRVGMVGRLAPWKGQDVFLRAFASAFPRGSEEAVVVGAAMFGEDDYERELASLVGDLSLAGRVTFRGFRADVFAELGDLDVLVHASIIPEPFGQVIIEGMAAGLPVVASDAGGPREIIVDGQDGLLYPPGDVEALAELLRTLAEDPALRSQLGERGKISARKYSPEQVGAAIDETYQRLLSRKAQKR